MSDRFLGRQIGKYRVIRLLGAGAFAWVYEAIDLDLEIPVALKVLRPEFAGDAEAEARFRREASTAARLRHANIVVVRDVGQSDGASFVAMDLLPRSVAGRLHELTRLPEAEVIRIALDVAAALATAHGANVIHRDIKPDNILLGASGEAIVADFGLARALANTATASATNSVTGTPHYFSPEQARGRTLDGRSDLYSLGVTMYRAATGRLPFEGDDWYVVGRAHIETPVTPLRTFVPELTAEFEAIVLRLLAKRPDDRFVNAAALGAALAALPTAPRDRVAMITPAVSVNTVDALAPITIPSRTPLRLLLGALTLVVALLTAWFVDGTRPITQQWFAHRRIATLPPISTAQDSVVQIIPRDTVRPIDTLRAVAASPPPIVQSARPPVLARAQLRISAGESAAIFVDGKQLGITRLTFEHGAVARLPIRVELANAPLGCSAARRDTTVRVRDGDRIALSLPVRSCVRLTLNVTPRDARVVFTPLDGGQSLTARGDTTGTVLLANGKYRIDATAPNCGPYAETFTTAEKARDGVVAIRIQMLC